MAKMIKKRSIKAGLPPGTLIHIGEKKAGEPVVTLIDYDEANHQESGIKTVEECIPFREKPTITWINVEGVHEAKVVERLGNCFGLHPLVLEDVMNTDQRPKIEDYTEYLYIVLKMLRPRAAWPVVDPVAVDEEPVEAVRRDAQRGLFQIIERKRLSRDDGLVVGIGFALRAPDPFRGERRFLGA